MASHQAQIEENADSLCLPKADFEPAFAELLSTADRIIDQSSTAEQLARAAKKAPLPRSYRNNRRGNLLFTAPPGLCRYAGETLLIPSGRICRASTCGRDVLGHVRHRPHPRLDCQRQVSHGRSQSPHLPAPANLRGPVRNHYVPIAKRDKKPAPEAALAVS